MAALGGEASSFLLNWFCLFIHIELVDNYQRINREHVLVSPSEHIRVISEKTFKFFSDNSGQFRPNLNTLPRFLQRDLYQLICWFSLLERYFILEVYPN
jgi:hypothetical protein